MSGHQFEGQLEEESESEVVREVTIQANAAEQTTNIRTAAEALVAALTKESDDYDGLVYYEYAKELADLQVALSRGWLARKESKGKKKIVSESKYQGGLGDTAMQRAWMRYADTNEVPHDHEDEEAFKYGFDDGASSGNRKAKLEIAEEIENHSYLAGTHEMCVWIDGLTKRLREEGK